MKDMNQTNDNTLTLYARKRHSKFNNYKSPNTKNPNKSFASRNGATFSKSSFDKNEDKMFLFSKAWALDKGDEATSNSKRKYSNILTNNSYLYVDALIMKEGMDPTWYIHIKASQHVF
jgi:hypothetical protein